MLTTVKYGKINVVIHDQERERYNFLLDKQRSS